MSLRERVQADVIAAMKAKDASTTAALRMLKTSLGNAEIEARGSGKAFDDAMELACVKRHAKQLAEAAEEYRKGGRADLVNQTETELKIIEQYLPVAMSEAEVRKVVAAVRAKSGAMQMGPFMGAVMKELKGGADGNLVRKIVEEVLKS